MIYTVVALDPSTYGIVAESSKNKPPAGAHWKLEYCEVSDVTFAFVIIPLQIVTAFTAPIAIENAGGALTFNTAIFLVPSQLPLFVRPT